jgi:hypothetical protein
MKINQDFFSWKTTKKTETLMEKVKRIEIRKCIKMDNTDYIIISNNHLFERQHNITS